MNEEVPKDANAGCPGVNSEMAGRADACQGCPNQAICAAAPKGPDPDIGIVAERLRSVKHIILVLSGKGGVGKSTFASQIAYALAARSLQVGLMDTDICGPSVPLMMGVTNEIVHQSSLGWSPVYVRDNLAVMSVGFMMRDPDAAVIWRGPKKHELIKNFLRDVDWGELDYLIVDTPPGTSDEHLSVVQLLKQASPDGAVLITTPQDVAIDDVRRELTFCRKVSLPVLGVVENMSRFVCPHCQGESHIFRPKKGGGGEGLAAEFAVPFLGRVPLDPRIVRAAESGESLFPMPADDDDDDDDAVHIDVAQLPASAAVIWKIVDQLVAAVQTPTAQVMDTTAAAAAAAAVAAFS